MYAMEQFIQSSVILIILSVSSVISSENPYLCIFFSGLLMIVFIIRSLSEKNNAALIAVQIICSVTFSILSWGFVSFLIFYECRPQKYKGLQIMFPALVYGTAQIIMPNSPALPQIVLNLIILTAVCAIIYLAEYLILNYITARNQIDKAIIMTAVNEMYERKLNNQLIIKNYLADKNARLEERENISRNIHNSVGHSITAAIMTLDAADLLFDSDPDKSRAKMNTANKHIRTSLNTIRHAVRTLDNESEFISLGDFISDLDTICENFMMDSMIKVRSNFVNSDKNLMIPHEHTEFLTGAVEELLTNGLRHGKAALFTVALTADSGHIKISVSDNGVSDFSEKNQHERINNGYGLKKLVSYTEKCGGSVIFENVNGFKSMITLPLYREGFNE